MEDSGSNQILEQNLCALNVLETLLAKRKWNWSGAPIFKPCGTSQNEGEGDTECLRLDTAFPINDR